MKPAKPLRAAGRPRAFNPEQALDRALQVFWRNGYEGASLSDLTKAMGINRPSLYAAFGDKQALFRRAIDRYSEGPAAYMRDALNEPTARAVVERLFRGAIDLQSCGSSMPGCLLIHGALACGEEGRPVQRELVRRRKQAEAAIGRRLQRAKDEGELKADSDPADLARYIATVLQGMAVQSASGASPEQLHRVIDTALQAWPS